MSIEKYDEYERYPIPIVEIAWLPLDIKREAKIFGIELTDEEAEDVLLSIKEELIEGALTAGWMTIHNALMKIKNTTE